MDSAIQSFTARLGNVPSHKSVGKNGSFWLPPESTNSFSSKLKDFSSNKSRQVPKNHNKNSSPSDLSSRHAEGGRTQSKLIVTQKLSRSVNSAKSNILQSTISNSNVKNTNGSTLQTQTNLLPQTTLQDTLLSNKNQVTRGGEKKPQGNDNLLSKDKEHQIVGDKEDQEGHKNDRDHGTKDAKLGNLMLMSERLKFILTHAASMAKSENRFEEKSLKLLEHLAREVVSKIATLDKNESKIVRMAFDLPNGSSLSVRIEKSASNLSISFITEDSEAQEVIEFIQELFSRYDNESRNSSISVYLFKSYQDMDSFFQQAA